MEFPKNLKYTKEHEWVKLEGSSAVLGITEFAQQELGDIVFVDLPAVGKTLKKGDSVCVVESTKAASDVYCGVGGTVAAVNSELSNAPQRVNKSPYGDGWMVKLDKVNKADFDTLLSPEAYKEFLGDKV